MRKTRIGALLASSALASATILGGAGIASAQGDSSTDSVTSGSAEVVATANDQCEVEFDFVGDATDDEMGQWNWVVDYRVGDEPATIASDEEDEDLAEALSVFRPVVASNQGAADSLNGMEDQDYDVGVRSNSVNLNDVVEPNETGEHTVSFKFYRGATPDGGWEGDANKGEVTVTGCETADDEDGGIIGSIVGSVDVFGSLGNMS